MKMNWIENIFRDVRHALRTIRKMPAVAAVVIVSLGIGIGVNAAVFSWIQAVALQPIAGVANSGKFFSLEPRTEAGGYAGTSWLEFLDLQPRLRLVSDLFATRIVPCNVGVAGEAERAFGMQVSGNYFSALRLQPALGRFIGAGETARAGESAVAVISYGYWQSHFGGAASVLGREIRVNNHALTIIGVAPRNFQGTVTGLDFDLWLPATMGPVLFDGSRELEDRGVRGYSMMARLQPGVTPAQAQIEYEAAMAQLAHDFPETNSKIHGEVLPLRNSPRGPQRFLVTALVTLQVLMLLVMLAVCGNTANLMLARGSTRQQEMVIRRALGASTWRIASLVMTENLALAFLGICLGVPIAMWGSNVLRAVPMIGSFPIRFQTGVDAGTISFAAILGLACGLAFGAGPAIHLARASLKAPMRLGAHSGPRGGLRNIFMATEVSLALIVLFAAALFLRSFSDTRQVDPGFRRDGILLAAYDLTGRSASDPTPLDFARRLVERLRVLPGVRSAAIATSVPLDIHGLPDRSFVLEGRGKSDAAPDSALTNTVTPDYFTTMNIPLMEGTNFADMSDVNAAPQAIVNQEFVRRYIGNAEAIGRHIEVGTGRYAIIAVARNSLYDSFGESPAAAIYFSYRDRPAANGEIHIFARAGGELPLASDVRRIVREIDPGLPIYDVRTLADHIDKNLLFRRIPARMFAVLGPLLLVLAAIGIYAVVGYSVSRRTTEIGVRLALGATPGRVVRQIVTETLQVICVGAAAGWAIGFVIAREVALVGSFDVPIFIGVPFLLLAVATFACWLPASRAARVEPVVALRHE
jgi:predicted permease